MKPLILSAAVLAASLGAASAAPLGGIDPLEAPRGGLERVEIMFEQMSSEQRVAYTRSLQEELGKHGYNAGPIDGVFGPKTRAATRAYQRDAGLPVTGRGSKELVEHLMFNEPKIYASRSSDPPAASQLVTKVQIELADRGYYYDAIDGLYGPKTRAAIQDFQRDAGFEITGRVDQRLLEELRSADPAIRAEASY